jgi:MFS superfamily sulfate permease-like transporter
VLYTAAVAVAAGIVLIIAAQVRIGWIAEFLSKPIVTGFVLGLTVLVIIGELPNLTGIPVSATDVLGRIQALAFGLDEIKPLTAAIGFGALAILMLGSRFVPKLPWSLVILLVGLIASAVFMLPARGVAVVGAVPAGLPGLQVPLIPVNKIPDVLFAGAALGFVGLAEGLSAARLFAVKGGYRVDTDQELMAAGVGCLGCGLVGGLAVAGSLSKTAASDRAGGKTQVVGLTAAVLSLAVILFLAPALAGLPKAVLSAIVVGAVWGLIDIAAMRRYRATRRNDFIAASAAAVGVLVAGPLLGLLFAIGLSILGLVFRSSRVTVDVMGKVPGEKASWGALENHPERATIAGVLILRINESLFWVNATLAQDRVLALVDQHQDQKAIVLDLESSDQLDVTSADQLGLLVKPLLQRWGFSRPTYIGRLSILLRVFCAACAQAVPSPPTNPCQVQGLDGHIRYAACFEIALRRRFWTFRHLFGQGCRWRGNPPEQNFRSVAVILLERSRFWRKQQRVTRVDEGGTGI